MYIKIFTFSYWVLFVGIHPVISMHRCVQH